MGSKTLSSLSPPLWPSSLCVFEMSSLSPADLCCLSLAFVLMGVTVHLVSIFSIIGFTVWKAVAALGGAGVDRPVCSAWGGCSWVIKGVGGEGATPPPSSLLHASLLETRRGVGRSRQAAVWVPLTCAATAGRHAHSCLCRNGYASLTNFHYCRLPPLNFCAYFYPAEGYHPAL